MFGRLVSPEVRDQLLQGELMLGGQEVEVTVLLSDIRGFTALCESMKPRDIVLTLNEYFTRMTEAVQRYGGYVNNFMGDAMVAVFGAPQPDPNRVVRALYAAVEMQVALDEFNHERSAYAPEPIVIGIGFAAIRDFVSFLRHGTKDNPLAPQEQPRIRHALERDEIRSDRRRHDLSFQIW